MKKQIFLSILLISVNAYSSYPTSEEFQVQLDACLNMTVEQQKDMQKQIEWLQKVVTPANIAAYFEDKYDDLKLANKEMKYTHKNPLLDFEDIVVVSSDHFIYRNIKDSKFYAKKFNCPLALHFFNSIKEENFFVSSSCVPSPYRGEGELPYICVVIYGTKNNKEIMKNLIKDSERVIYKLTRADKKIYMHGAYKTLYSI